MASWRSLQQLLRCEHPKQDRGSPQQQLGRPLLLLEGCCTEWGLGASVVSLYQPESFSCTVSWKSPGRSKQKNMLILEIQVFFFSTWLNKTRICQTSTLGIKLSSLLNGRDDWSLVSWAWQALSLVGWSPPKSSGKKSPFPALGTYCWTYSITSTMSSPFCSDFASTPRGTYTRNCNPCVCQNFM